MYDERFSSFCLIVWPQPLQGRTTPYLSFRYKLLPWLHGGEA